MRPAAVVVVFCLAASYASPADKDKDKAGKASKTVGVDLRALPRVAAAPVTVTFNVALSGGVAAQTCPTLEWDWGDGTQSVQEDACEAADAHFTATHEYRSAVRPRVTLAVKREGRTLGQASIALVIGEPKKPLTGSFRQTPH